ncbi:MAG: hypothetical protein F6K58_03550 [Symploca sp. SIO2E9]|nr:hypothetical protein [Symploca sp. SIO2E9]
MANQHIQYEDSEDALSNVQVELLDLLLQPEEDFYPWNPAELETEAYFTQLEREFLLEYPPEEEAITGGAQAFFKQLNHCWTSTESSVKDSLEASLLNQFGLSLPQTWLEEIAKKARLVFSSNLSLAEQLVLCVQPLLPSWTEEDLSIFARPLALPMRGKSELGRQADNGAVESVEWTELSQIEQVRLSLKVAHSAIIQLQSKPGNCLEQPFS